MREILRQLCKYKGVEILEGHLMADHIHMLVSIPMKISVSNFMGYLKGKSALMTNTGVSAQTNAASLSNAEHGREQYAEQLAYKHDDTQSSYVYGKAVQLFTTDHPDHVTHS